MRVRRKKETITLIDRFAIGFLSAICFLLTYWVCFILLAIVTQGYAIVFFSLRVIGFLTVFFFVLGFVTLDNYFIKIFAPVWKFIDEEFSRW